MSEPGSARQAADQAAPRTAPAGAAAATTALDAVPAEIGPGATAALAAAGTGAPGREVVAGIAREAVGAWLAAVNGDEAALLAAGDPDTVAQLLRPLRQDWVIAPGPEVSAIVVSRLDLGGGEAGMDVRWRFTASQRYGGPVIPPGWLPARDGKYAGWVTLALAVPPAAGDAGAVGTEPADPAPAGPGVAGASPAGTELAGAEPATIRLAAVQPAEAGSGAPAPAEPKPESTGTAEAGETGETGAEPAGALAEPDAEPAFGAWRLVYGAVETEDEYYGYTFTTRDEGAAEYQQRTGLPASAAALVPSGTYRLAASYAEHDHRFGGEAVSDVDSDDAPDRDEAERLVSGAVDAEARRHLAAIYPRDGATMEARPSLSSLAVIRLLDLAPPVEPVLGLGDTTHDAAGEADAGATVDEFARRYAASRRLTFTAGRAPAWRDPGPWFLASLDVSRARGLVWGPVSGFPPGEAWFAESAARSHGGRQRWTVAHFTMLPAQRAGGIALAVRRGRAPWHGSPLPRGLAETPTGDQEVDRRYVVGVAGGDQRPGDGPWAERVFTPGFTAWLGDQPYGEQGADATCFQLQGGLLCAYTRGWLTTQESLDAFRERAARIAATLEHATRFVVM